MTTKYDFVDEIALPFADQRTIDMRRCRSILHVSSYVIRRLSVTPLQGGGQHTCLVAYNLGRSSPYRIDYASLVRFLDHLREVHCIPDRRPAITFGRHRDEDLLPFRWSDTMTAEETASVLDIHRSQVLPRIEAGQIEAYQIARKSPWRISRNSLAKYIATLTSMQRNVCPYDVRAESQGEM